MKPAKLKSVRLSRLESLPMIDIRISLCTRFRVNEVNQTASVEKKRYTQDDQHE